MRVTRLRVVAAVVVALGLVQILWEDAVVFVATTGDRPLASPLVNIAVPMTIALLLILVLIGGALYGDD